MALHVTVDNSSVELLRLRVIAHNNILSTQLKFNRNGSLKG